jgi:alpha-D-ribose 1-methylphosphonate 5-triphosphate diphosphatase
MAWIHEQNNYDGQEKTQKRKKALGLMNARILTPEGLILGALTAKDGVILEAGLVPPGFPGGDQDLGLFEDLAGDILVPGFVELHTDNLEKHIMPRPGIYWTDPVASLEAHDAQLVSSGITTVFDSVCVGEPVDIGRRAMLPLSLNALKSSEAKLRASHYLHLRCEISDPMMENLFSEALSIAKPDLLSIMDHTPGQRQWRTPKDWLVYHQAKLSDEELQKVSAALKTARDACAIRNIQIIASYARENNIPLASHDDTNFDHIQDALALGAVISEFPTTMESAKFAREKGLKTILGTPNLIRGGSHSGNVKVKDVAEAGYLSCLSSDYAPSSLGRGAYKLYRDHGFSINDAFDTVSANPAEVAGLADRGKIVPGKRADLVRLRELEEGRVSIISVWVGGERVF